MEAVLLSGDGGGTHHDINDKIKITVRDKVLLNPSGDVWITVHSYIKYAVERWREGKPSSKYCIFVLSLFRSGLILDRVHSRSLARC